MSFDVEKLHIPAEPFYTKNHEWLTIDENVITFGITSYAADKLGEVLYVDLPEEGSKISAQNAFAELESARRVIDLVGSFNGTILEVNSRLLDDPSSINDDTYGEGWILVAEMENERDLAGLLRHGEYKAYLKELETNRVDSIREEGFE